jgi:hypothetical protein
MPRYMIQVRATAMSKAGVLLDAAGQVNIMDGPFAETKELIAGYTLIEVRSHDEALASPSATVRR